MSYTVREINDEVNSNRKLAVERAENKYKENIKKIVKRVLKSNIKLIMLAGPSASGKTTTAHILRDMLRLEGKKSYVMSLDDFYLTPDKMPRQANGEPDFESVYSLDVKGINEALNDICDGKECSLPVFSFNSRKPSVARKIIDAGVNRIVIVEGLHALNPVLLQHLNKDEIFKIYIGTTDDIVDNGEVLIYHKNIRLIRRMTRDIFYRNTSVEQTFTLWKNVVVGENKNLKPYKPTADCVFDTFHKYELLVYKPIICKYLNEVKKNSEHYDLAQSLLNALCRFGELDTSIVPQDSVIREFIPKDN